MCQRKKPFRASWAPLLNVKWFLIRSLAPGMQGLEGRLAAFFLNWRPWSQGKLNCSTECEVSLPKPLHLSSFNQTDGTFSLERGDCYPWLSCVSSSIFLRNVLIAAKILTRLQVLLMLGDSSQLWESGCQFAWYLSKIKMFLTGRLGSYFKCPVFTECAAGSFRGRDFFSCQL